MRHCGGRGHRGERSRCRGCGQVGVGAAKGVPGAVEGVGPAAPIGHRGGWAWPGAVGVAQERVAGSWWGGRGLPTLPTGLRRGVGVARRGGRGQRVTWSHRELGGRGRAWVGVAKGVAGRHGGGRGGVPTPRCPLAGGGGRWACPRAGGRGQGRGTPDIRITDVTIFVDPFEEFLKEKQTQDARAKGQVEKPAAEEEDDSRREEDSRMTWTGKRVRGAGAGTTTDDGSTGGVGKYLKATLAEQATQGDEDEIVEVVDEDPEPEPVRKKVKATGGFGDFSSW